MSGRCIIISGGAYADVPAPQAGDYVIACDLGYAHARRAGIRPDLVVGDFDSYEGDVDGVPVLRYKCEKDDTDTMIAVRHAIERPDCREIVLCCALGGRLDHSYANLQSAAFALERGVGASVLGADARVYFARPDAPLRLKAAPGWSLSVFSFSERCEGVALRGAKYPLEDYSMTNAFPIGVSNAWRAEFAEISVRRGTLMVMLCRLDAAK